MRISVSGNTKFFQDRYTPSLVKIDVFDITGKGFELETDLAFNKNNTVLYKERGNIFFRTTKAIVGSDFAEIPSILKINDKHITYPEIGLIKALFNIYYWVEFSLLHQSEEDIQKIFFNELILDNNSKIGTQRDIYLLPQNFLAAIPAEIIEQLLKANLLCKTEITIDNISLFNYFVPFLKPGVNLNYLKTSVDPLGVETHKLWNTILKARDEKIRTILNIGKQPYRNEAFV